MDNDRQEAFRSGLELGLRAADVVWRRAAETYHRDIAALAREFIRHPAWQDEALRRVAAWQHQIDAEITELIEKCKNTAALRAMAEERGEPAAAAEEG